MRSNIEVLSKVPRWTFPAVALVAAVACGAAIPKSGDPDGGEGAVLDPGSYDATVSLAPLVEAVAPAVVNIRTTAKVRRGHGFLDPGDLFEWFFGPRSPMPRRSPDPEDWQTRRSLGSGFVISKDGLVVTNHHVVNGADEIEVQLADDRTFSAELVGSDDRTDVALLRLVDASDLPAVSMGDSDSLRVGDRVVAIGNPFGLDHTVTEGIVSAKERVIGAGPYDDFIQTDASINPGNSGGPLFDLSGRVVGINTAIAPQGQGIGFAIPASLASEVIDALRSGGKVVRGWLGIAFQPVDEDLATAFGLEEPGGAVVVNVTEGSPAEKGGVRTGDVIVAVDGEDLRSARRLPSAVAKLAPGERVPFVVIRDGKRRTIRIEIGEMPGDLAGAIRRPRSGEGEEETGDLGFSVRPLDDRLRERLGAEDVEGGVVVGSVEPGSAASRALRSGDVIVEVNRDPIRDEEDFEEKVSGTKEGDDLLLLVYRRGSWLYLVLRP